MYTFESSLLGRRFVVFCNSLEKVCVLAQQTYLDTIQLWPLASFLAGAWASLMLDRWYFKDGPETDVTYS